MVEVGSESAHECLEEVLRWLTQETASVVSLQGTLSQCLCMETLHAGLVWDGAVGGQKFEDFIPRR